MRAQATRVYRLPPRRLVCGALRSRRHHRQYRSYEARLRPSAPEYHDLGPRVGSGIYSPTRSDCNTSSHTRLKRSASLAQ